MLNSFIPLEVFISSLTSKFPGILGINFNTCNAGNTRVITQNALQTFQEEMAKVKKDPYKVIMKQTKLPITLLNETAKVGFSSLVHVAVNSSLLVFKIEELF